MRVRASDSNRRAGELSAKRQEAHYPDTVTHTEPWATAASQTPSKLAPRRAFTADASATSCAGAGPVPQAAGPERSCEPRIAESRLTVPVYVYRRQNGSTFEIEQRITKKGLVSCPTTGQSVERVLQPFTPHYKGTGFYSTDHRKPKAKEPPKGGAGK